MKYLIKNNINYINESKININENPNISIKDNSKTKNKIKKGNK